MTVGRVQEIKIQERTQAVADEDVVISNDEVLAIYYLSLIHI